MHLAKSVDEDTKKQFLFWYFVGTAHHHLKQFSDAIDAYHQAKAINSQQPQLLIKLVEACIHNASFEQAYLELDNIQSNFKQLLAKDWFRLGVLHHQLNQEDRALACFNNATAQEPQNIDFQYNKALALKNCGLLIEAKQTLILIMQKTPGHVEAFHALVLLEKAQPDQNYITEIQALLPANTIQNQIKLRFSLAKNFEDLGEFGKSFEQLEIANQQRRNQLRYDVNNDVALMESLAKTFSASERQSTNETERPIFIVGLPRSGSTLVERILTQPEDVTSAGELLHFSALIARQVKLQFEDCRSQTEFVAKSALISTELLAEEYLKATDALTGKARYLVDKMPLNFLNVGLICKALPQAKIVYVKRAPIDNLVAIYKTLFEQAYPYAYSQEDIAHYICAERRLMSYWLSQYPDQIHVIQYEDLVKDPKVQASSLYEFCHLSFSEQYLELSRNSSAAATASAAQVRKGIYQSSVEKWRQYEPYLAPAMSVFRNNDFCNYDFCNYGLN